MNEEKEHREKMIDRKWALLDAIAQGYCQNPEFASTDYEPLADMIVRTANAVKERILQDPRIKATDAIKKGDVIESKTKMITVGIISTSKNGLKIFKGATDDEPKEFCNNVGNEWLIHNSKNTIRRLCISILAEWIHEISCIQDADDIVSYGCTLIAYVQTKHFWLALQLL